MDQLMVRTPWTTRDRTIVTEKLPRGRPRGSHPEVDFERINRALSDGAPATLSAPEVRAITGWRTAQLAREIRERNFPSPLNPEKHSWRMWASVDIRDWLLENGLPTVFGKAAQ
jgi:hypothetical protein